MKAMNQNPGGIVRRPRNHQRLHNCMAINQHVLFLYPVICMYMHVYAYINIICKYGNYMQFLYAYLYAKICTHIKIICKNMQKYGLTRILT